MHCCLIAPRITAVSIRAAYRRGVRAARATTKSVRCNLARERLSNFFFSGSSRDSNGSSFLSLRAFRWYPVCLPAPTGSPFTCLGLVRGRRRLEPSPLAALPSRTVYTLYYKEGTNSRSHSSRVPHACAHATHPASAPAPPRPSSLLRDHRERGSTRWQHGMCSMRWQRHEHHRPAPPKQLRF
jgi:hypothetical protein